MDKLKLLKDKSLMLEAKIKKWTDKKNKVDAKIIKLDPDWNKEETDHKINEAIRDFERDVPEMTGPEDTIDPDDFVDSLQEQIARNEDSD